MQFSYGGQELSSAELSKCKESRNPVTRRNARKAIRKAFADSSEEYSSVLRELVKVRGQIAEANGYATQMDTIGSYGDSAPFTTLQDNCPAFHSHILQIASPSLLNCASHDTRQKHYNMQADL